MNKCDSFWSQGTDQKPREYSTEDESMSLLWVLILVGRVIAYKDIDDSEISASLKAHPRIVMSLELSVKLDSS